MGSIVGNFDKDVDLVIFSCANSSTKLRLRYQVLFQEGEGPRVQPYGEASEPTTVRLDAKASS